MSHLLQWDLAPQGVQDRHARLFPRPLLQEWGGVQTRTLHMHRVSALKPTPDPLLGACRGVLSLLSMQARLSCMHTYTLTNQAVRLRLVGRIEGGRESVRSWAILARVPAQHSQVEHPSTNSTAVTLLQSTPQDCKLWAYLSLNGMVSCAPTSCRS